MNKTILSDARDGHSIDDLRALAQDRDMRASDTVCVVKPINLIPERSGLALTTSQGNLPLTPRALAHVARHIAKPGIVADTFRSLPPDARESLLRASFSEDRFTVRIYHLPHGAEDRSVVRGLLSDTYQPRPCLPLLDEALRALDRAGMSDRDTTRGVTQNMIHNPDRWSMRLVRTDFGRDFQAGRGPSGTVFPCVDIRSDDSGGGSARIIGGLWRRVCNNGLCLQEASAMRRIIHKRGARWSAVKGDVIPANWLSLLQDSVADTVTVPVYAERILLEALRSHTPSRIREATERNRLELSTADLARMLSLESLTDEGRIPASDIRNGPLSRWALSQSAALVGRQHAAQGRDDRADTCESAAGILLSHPLSYALPDLAGLAV